MEKEMEDSNDKDAGYRAWVPVTNVAAQGDLNRYWSFRPLQYLQGIVSTAGE